VNPPHLHQPVREGERHGGRQVRRRRRHCHRGAGLHGVVLRQHLHLRVRPNHHGLLLLLAGLHGAAGAQVLPGGHVRVAAGLVTP